MSFFSKRQSLKIHEKCMSIHEKYMRNRVKKTSKWGFCMYFICISHVFVVFCLFLNPNYYLILSNIHEIYMRYTYDLHV